MGAALRIILILVIAWYIVRFINRYITPVLFGSPKKDKVTPGTKEKKFRKSTRQGDVTITDYGKRSKEVNPGDDDYIDYEEVE